MTAPAADSLTSPPSSMIPIVRSPLVLAAIILVATLGLVAAESFVSLAIVFTDGLVALAVLVVAALAGAVVLRAIHAPCRSFGQRLIFSLGLGVGLVSLLQLAMGLVGVLHRTAWIVAAAAIVLTFVLTFRRDLARLLFNQRITLQPLHALHILWLLVIPFLAITLLAATMPPGSLWQQEANGYDVLEYHLGGPKQYLQNGQITLLPENVYTNFPANAEMLYLLAMVLAGGPIKAVFIAKLLNASLAILTVAAMWTAAQPLGRRPAIIAGVLAGTCGWLVYLSGVAYVENAMLLFTALALGAWLRWYHKYERPNRWALLAGVFAGLACGCKYPAVALVAAPIAIAFLARVRQPAKRTIQGLCLFVCGTIVTFAPWCAEDLAFCGNPVFPLASEYFRASPEIFNAEVQKRWQRAHAPPEDVNRFTAILNRVVQHPRTGPVLWLLAAGGLVVAARSVWPLAIVVLLQLAVWAGLTHLVDRFAVPILPPLILLAAAAFTATERSILIAGCAAVALNAAFRAHNMWNVYTAETRVNEDGKTVRVPWQGQTEWFTDGELPGSRPYGYVNHKLPATARVLLVGEARHFYFLRPYTYNVVFSPNPLAEYVRAHDVAGVLDWLRQSGYTHVYVNFSEIDRLRETYGYWPEIDDELFTRLERAGLRRIETFRYRPDGPAFAVLYEVPS